MASEHNPPHFYAIYGEYIAEFGIRTLEMFEGDLPIKAQKLVRKWAEQYQQELMEMWNKQEFKLYRHWNRVRKTPIFGLRGDDNMSTLKIKSVEPLDNIVLLVTFDNRVKKQYDIKQLLSRFPVFKALENRALFKLVKLTAVMA